jgi:hypothetical protein
MIAQNFFDRKKAEPCAKCSTVTASLWECYVDGKTIDVCQPCADEMMGLDEDDLAHLNSE